MLDGVCRSYLINPEGEEITISFFTSKSILSPYTTRTIEEISILYFQALTEVKIGSIVNSKKSKYLSHCSYSSSILNSSLLSIASTSINVPKFSTMSK